MIKSRDCHVIFMGTSCKKVRLDVTTLKNFVGKPLTGKDKDTRKTFVPVSRPRSNFTKQSFLQIKQFKRDKRISLRSKQQYLRF